MIRLRNKLKPASRLRYFFWRLNRSEDPIRVTLKTGITCELRPRPASDIDNAQRNVFSDGYRCPRLEMPGTVTKVADIGANMGLSCLVWANRYPQASIIGI